MTQPLPSLDDIEIEFVTRGRTHYQYTITIDKTTTPAELQWNLSGSFMDDEYDYTDELLDLLAYNPDEILELVREHTTIQTTAHESTICYLQVDAETGHVYRVTQPSYPNTPSVSLSRTGLSDDIETLLEQ